jgi:hypothetical protein
LPENLKNVWRLPPSKEAKHPPQMTTDETQIKTKPVPGEFLSVFHL